MRIFALLSLVIIAATMAAILMMFLAPPILVMGLFRTK